MNNIYQHYIIDLSSNNNFVQIPTMQGDGNNIRGFEVELIENGVQYIIDKDDCIISIMGTKPDTKQIMNPCEITDDGYILVDITSQMSAVTGRGDYQIVLMSKSTNSQLKSFPFHILTTSASFDIDYIVSTDEFQLLTKNVAQTISVIESANKAISDIRELESTVEESEASREDAESERNSAEALRQTAEATRQSNENTRKEAEINRQNAENDRITAETTRESNETVRITNEDARKTTEATRELNEDTRKANEADRQSAEDAREDAEKGRSDEEDIRMDNENARKEAETTRASEETKRANAETSRESNENTRQNNESARQTNETNRQSNTATAIANAETATERANTAAKACENIVAGTGFIASAEKGVANGVATLDSNGKLTDSQLSITPSNITPKANGTASVGTETDYARGDHVHPLQTTVSGNAGSATKWATTRNINGMTVNGTGNSVNYGICSTDAETAAKTVECKGFGLITGAAITVKFTVTNSAENPTLDINSTGAKPIYYRGKAISAWHLAANRTYTFRYNGAQYDLVGDIDIRLTLTNDLTSTSTTTALTAAQGKVLNDKITAIDSSLTSGTTQFYFDNHDGKFGWNSDPARGADTFHPFSDGGTEELYEALKYSGIVTPDMSFEEMCIALAERFPAEFLLYHSGNLETDNSGGWGTGIFDAGTGDGKVTFGSSSVTLTAGFRNSHYQGQSLIYTKNSLDVGTDIKSKLHIQADYTDGYANIFYSVDTPIAISGDDEVPTNGTKLMTIKVGENIINLSDLHFKKIHIGIVQRGVSAIRKTIISKIWLSS